MGDVLITKERCNFCNGSGTYGAGENGCHHCHGVGEVILGAIELPIFLGDLITKLDTLDTKMDTLDAHLDTIEAKIDAL